MRSLSRRQIDICERSNTRRCKCRCKGVFHGITRIEISDGRRIWVQLPLVPVPEELADAHRPPNKD